MFTIKTWHLYVPSPISKHPNASIREITSVTDGTLQSIKEATNEKI